MKDEFRQRLAQGRPIIIDGGFATELEAQGHDLNNILWSASLIESQPEAIIAAHRAYLDAGAEIIISASYQTNDPELTAASIALACQARDAFVADNPAARQPLVAASVGPYGAAQGDGSEYSGDYGVDAETIRQFHLPRLAAIESTNADLFACETVPSRQEAEVVADLFKTYSLDGWVSFSCQDRRHLCDGSPLVDVAHVFESVDRVLAVGINCTNPQYITDLVGEVIDGAPNKSVVIYPNSGEDFDGVAKTWSGTVTAVDWQAAAATWSEAGATIIGGCCRTTPAHIHALTR
ncbi:MAG: homocysteine S-methyltransferase [Pseudomonadota bacterium]